MTNQIVTVNVSVVAAPQPSLLQNTGAAISQGATLLAPGSSSFLTQLADLTPILAGSKALSSLTWLAGTVTATTATAHGFTVGDTLPITIVGVTPAGYNGTFTATVTSGTQFTYSLASNPGSETVPGQYTPEDVAELYAMCTTFFAQGAGQGLWVLELGAGNASDGVTALTAYLTANPGQFYAFLVPRYWDSNASFLTMIANYEANNSQLYFFVTTTLQNYGNYKAAMKDVWTMIESPALGSWQANAITAASYAGGQITFTTTANHGVAVGQWFQIAGMTPAGYNGWFQAALGTATNSLLANVSANPGAETVLGTLLQNSYSNTGVSPTGTEFTMAAVFQDFISRQPSSANKMVPFAFDFLSGVTPFPTRGMSATLAALKTANVNVISTAAQGGLTPNMLLWGVTQDGNDGAFWYSVDWAQIQSSLALSSAVISGSNNAVNPLYYNQQGVNTLQDVLVAVMNQAVTYGLANGTVVGTRLDPATFNQNLANGVYAGQIVVNAVPYAVYTAQNPGDYAIGKYAGFTAVYIVQNGFKQIVFNILVTQFVNV